MVTGGDTQLCDTHTRALAMEGLSRNVSFPSSSSLSPAALGTAATVSAAAATVAGAVAVAVTAGVSEQEVAALELASLARERDWLLQVEAPRVLNDIRTQLERVCMSLNVKQQLVSDADQQQQQSPMSSVTLGDRGTLKSSVSSKTLSLDEILAQARSTGKKKPSVATVAPAPAASGAHSDGDDDDDEHDGSMQKNASTATAKNASVVTGTPSSGSSNSPSTATPSVLSPTSAAAPLSKASRRAAAAAEAEEEADRVISFKSHDGHLSGFVVLHGHALLEAELGITFQRTSRAPLEVEIRPSRPWRLVQLQNCLHYTQDALSLACVGGADVFEPCLAALRSALDEITFRFEVCVCLCARKCVYVYVYSSV